MKTSKLLALLLVLVICISMTACDETKRATKITLSDEEITVDGEVISTNATDAVYVANDIISNDKINAANQTVVHITKPGTYTLSGQLSFGQIAVDLGDDAKSNPEAVVTLILNNVNINCDIAPAVIFYNAYECATTDLTDDAEKVNTKNAGANILIADKSVNTLNGSYVMGEFGASVYSCVSMNLNGGRKNSGELYVNAFTDRGDAIASEGYLVINGGNVNAVACSISGNAGLNSGKGILINGGNVVATGHLYDEIVGGKQNFAVFQFVESQMGGNIYEVKNEKEKTILSAQCSNDFTILVVSGKNLKEATYSFWCEDVQFFVAEGFVGGFMGDPSLTAPEGMAQSQTLETEVDEENADIVFDIEKGGNLFHVFY